MVNKYRVHINGRFIDSRSKKTYNVINPATEEVIAKVPLCDKEDTKHAVESARKAFEEWQYSTPSERASYLNKLADLVEKNLLRLAKLESLNTGKTIKYARDSDLPFIVDNLRFFAGVARILEGKADAEYADYHKKEKHKAFGTSSLRREPIGVVGAIVPWNYPLYIAVWKIAPALAAGNTIVIKPASYTPLTLLEFAKFVEKIGIPKGVFNVVTGPGEVVGTELASNTNVDMIALTGDTSTGKKIMQLASSNVKRLHLELGGKAPLIVLDDADLDAAAKGAVTGAFWNTGQDCTAVTRVYVPDKLHGKFVKMLVDETKKFRIGDPQNEHIDMGPLISARQRERIEMYIESGKKQGAKIVIGGKRPNIKKGFYIEPTIFTDVKHYSRICQEEIFGPVLSVFKYRDVDEAVNKSNDVVYGLASSVWGKNINKCLDIARRLKFGTVWINEHGILLSEMPHGGYKQSGFGKDLGIQSLEEYTQLKHVYIDQTNLARKPWHYVVYGEP
ncbi:MAG: aminobutyraldehyde dehydrogenase [Nanoarchaeota archaeon]